MSKATKKRFVHRQMETEYVTPGDKQFIAKVISSPGNNLHEISDERGETFLASMPNKFRNTVWIKRGQFVVFEDIDEGDKVKGEIIYVLDTDSILYIDELGRWPKCFSEEADKLKRTTKRNLPAGSDAMIDPDMLPPSDSEEDEEAEDGEENESDDNNSVDDEDEEDNEIIETYNPNRPVV